MSVREILVKEIHAPARRHFPRTRVVVKGVLDESWEADLIVLTHPDRGYRYILVVIDRGSKFLSVEPLKRKTSLEVSRAMNRIFKRLNLTPTHLQTDAGKEFYGKEFRELMVKKGINHYRTFSNLKATMAERVIRTLKEALFRHFNLIGSYKWVDHIQKLADSYNGRIHSSTGFRPKDVRKKHESLIVHRLATANKRRKQKNKFFPGDMVRISKFRHIFSKGYTPRWSTETFKVDQVFNRDVPMYTLLDSSDNQIRGKFYQSELLKTKLPGYYLIERVLRRKKNLALVRWLGFSSDHDSWVNVKDIT